MLNNYVVMESASPGEMSRFINQSVGYHNLNVLGAGSAADSVLKHLPSKSISFSVIRYGTDVQIIGPPKQNSYQIQLVLSGNSIVSHCGKTVNLCPGDAAVINPDSECSLVYKNNCEKLIITLDSDVVKKGLVDRIGMNLKKPLHFDLKINSDKDSGYFLELLKFYGNVVDGQKNNDNFSQISSTMLDTILDGLLKFQPSNYDFLLAKSFKDFPAHLKKAVAYIDQNLEDGFSVVDILDHIKVCERVLYKSFSEYMNISPNAYIKSLKLKKIRNVLISSQSNKIKVTQIAMDYGFSHLGRFSSDYKRIFGELPSQTLRKNNVDLS